MTFRIAGVILAGGLSRRMGGHDKSLKMLGGRAMLQHVIERLAPQVSAVLINANGDPARLAEFGLPVIPDTIGGYAGPLAGVLAAMQWASANDPSLTHIVTAATDTPFFPRDLVRRLTDAADGHAQRIVLAGSGGHRHPVFGLWPISLKENLAAWMSGTETYKVLAWVGQHDNVTCDFDFLDWHGRKVDPFFNANTPEELAEAEIILAESVS